MILTDDFVYLHMEKTGGTFVTSMLERVYGRDHLVNMEKHGTVSDIPPDYATRPVVATLRNPYERYVSQYRFGWWKLHPENFCGEAEMRRLFPHYPDLSFADYLELANTAFLGTFQKKSTGFENHNFAPERQLGWHTEQFVRFFFKNPRQVFARIDEDYIDRQRYREDMGRVRFLRVDRLNLELHDFLLEIGRDRREIDFILSAQRVLPAEGGREPGDRWQDYYTPPLLDYVRTRERLLFSMFPEFDAEPA